MAPLWLGSGIVSSAEQRIMDPLAISRLTCSARIAKLLAMLPQSFADSVATGDPLAVLQAALAHFDCQTGTVHLMRDGALRLAAHVNIPPPLLPIIDTVPIGKGIAGLAAERREAVSLCNLQTDTSGQARPAAKQTGMEGSVAVPMLAGTELRGVLGIAKAGAHDWSDAEKEVLSAFANAFAERL